MAGPQQRVSGRHRQKVAGLELQKTPKINNLHIIDYELTQN